MSNDGVEISRAGMLFGSPQEMAKPKIQKQHSDFYSRSIRKKLKIKFPAALLLPCAK